MRKVFISAGHSNTRGRDRGAAGNGYVEGDLTVEYRNLLTAELNKLGIKPIVDADNSILAETIRFFQNLTTNTCIVIDIHLNAAADPSATGTETLIPAQNTEFERNLAKAMSDDVARILGIPLRGNHAGLRGVKTELNSHHGRLGWMRLTGENILLETYFISNPNDTQKYQANKHLLAAAHARTISRFARGIESAVKPTSIVHTVREGETLFSIGRQHGVTPGEIASKNGIVNNNIRVGQTLKIK
jgi:N-acetylmuramoyl-L-alanine amidase